MRKQRPQGPCVPLCACVWGGTQAPVHLLLQLAAVMGGSCTAGAVEAMWAALCEEEHAEREARPAAIPRLGVCLPCTLNGTG